MRHSLAAGDELLAAEYVERSVHAVLNREAWRELENWLNLLPAGVKQRPALLVAQAWLEHFRFRYAGIGALLASARQGLRRAAAVGLVIDAAVGGNIYALECTVAGTLGDPAEALRTGTLALAQLPPDHVFARGLVQHHQLRATMQLGDTAAAVQEAQQLLAQNVQPDTQTLRVLLALCAIYFECADVAALEGAALMNLRLARQLHQPLSAGWATACLGWVCYQRNDFARARAYFESVIATSYHAHIRAVMESYIGLALIACAENQVAQARAAADALAAWLAESGFVNQMVFAGALFLHVDLAGSNPQSAQRPAQPFTVPDAGGFGGLQLWLMPLLVRVRAHLQAGAPSDLPLIAAALSRCRTMAAARNMQLRLIEVDALDALRCAAEGRREEALALLSESVTRAAAGGAQRVLLDLGPGLQPLLHEVLARGVAPDFVRRLLAASAQLPESAPVPMSVPPGSTTGTGEVDALSETGSGTRPDAECPAVVGGADMLLTNRELDVLFLLAQRLSDKEIAQTLVVSPRTVKKHAASIYQKLHVDNRRAAVNAARAQGILPHL